MVGELAFHPRVIDPKMNLTAVRLAVGHAAMVVDPQMHSTALVRIVPTDQITERVPQVLVGMRPQRDRKRSLAQLQSGSIAHFHKGIASVKPCSAGCTGR